MLSESYSPSLNTPGKKACINIYNVILMWLEIATKDKRLKNSYILKVGLLDHMLL